VVGPGAAVVEVGPAVVEVDVDVDVVVDDVVSVAAVVEVEAPDSSSESLHPAANPSTSTVVTTMSGIR
jgi:hypothetical protein